MEQTTRKETAGSIFLLQVELSLSHGWLYCRAVLSSLPAAGALGNTIVLLLQRFLA